jgi:hypothetical protein
MTLVTLVKKTYYLGEYYPGARVDAEEVGPASFNPVPALVEKI